MLASATPPIFTHRRCPPPAQSTFLITLLFLFADQWCLALDTLKEAAAHFSQLDCRERLRDVHYLQAQLHHLLGQTLQRNRAAMTFRLLDQELQSPPPPISMRL